MRYQELNWYRGDKFTPSFDVPILIRVADVKFPLRAVRISIPEVDYGCLYILWNEERTPNPNDITSTNIYTVEEVLEWSYI